MWLEFGLYERFGTPLFEYPGSTYVVEIDDISKEKVITCELDTHTMYTHQI